jgi:signal transduction histidine kinase
VNFASVLHTRFSLSSRAGKRRISFSSEASCCCAFLCDENGHVIDDFGEQRPGSGESLSARLLVSLIESSSLVEFLEAVRTRGIILGWETKVHVDGSARSLLLHGFQTQCGILVFAPMAPGSAALTDNRSAEPAALAESTANQLFEVAHDLQNPISSISSACEYLAAYSQDNLDPAQLEMIAGIESAAATLLQVSDRLSKLARSE